MKVKATDIAQMASASDVIFEALREAIAKGDITEGQTLRQDHIARMFNVSRIPVREALTRLEEQGLVSTQRYRGAVVATLSIDEVREIFEFRALLEPEILRYSVERISAEGLETAKRYAQAFSTEPDSSHWGELNRQFHYTLYEAAGRPYYLQTIRTALDRVDRYLRAQLVLTDGMARARREHEGILDACIARDADTAARLTREHILGACASLVSFLERTRAEETRGGGDT
ncbi:GntR family transcriptional regulator [Ancylobacter radicis]|uniref:GntR family transcriptional regulator n=1 Tax=Ancylobacter radicis TaxID=2836179 RepID=A0ABS5R5N7_9HYPH|nr:GntR family transcriptional regulator [Ancylobacter radicis]